MTTEVVNSVNSATQLLSGFSISDILMIGAVIIAPILAVQVEKYLEKIRNKNEEKLKIFKTLMATRGRILDPRHVEALNMIDLEFDGHKVVTHAWKAYLDHLINIPQYPTTENKNEEQRISEKTIYDSQIQSWVKQGEDYLAELLFTMGNSLNYKFDKTHIKRSIYSPRGHTDIENEQQILRRALIDLLIGKFPLSVEQVAVPLSEKQLESQREEQAEQKLIRELLIKHYKGEIPSLVKVVSET